MLLITKFPDCQAMSWDVGRCWWQQVRIISHHVQQLVRAKNLLCLPVTPGMHRTTLNTKSVCRAIRLLRERFTVWVLVVQLHIVSNSWKLPLAVNITTMPSIRQRELLLGMLFWSTTGCSLWFWMRSLLDSSVNMRCATRWQQVALWAAPTPIRRALNWRRKTMPGHRRPTRSSITMRNWRSVCMTRAAILMTSIRR